MCSTFPSLSLSHLFISHSYSILIPIYFHPHHNIFFFKNNSKESPLNSLPPPSPCLPYVKIIDHCIQYNPLQKCRQPNEIWSGQGLRKTDHQFTNAIKTYKIDQCWLMRLKNELVKILNFFTSTAFLLLFAVASLDHVHEV